MIIIHRDKQKNSDIIEIYSLRVDALQSSVTDVTNALKDIIYGLIDVSKLANSKFKIEIDIPNHDPNGPNVFPLKIVDKKSKEMVKNIDCCRARYISKAKSSCSATVGLFDNFTKPITTGITTNNKKQSKNNKKMESKANTVEMEIDKKDDEEEDNNQNPKTKKQKQMKRVISKKKEDKISEPNIVEKVDARQEEEEVDTDDLSGIFNNVEMFEDFEIIVRNEVDNQNSTGSIN